MGDNQQRRAHRKAEQGTEGGRHTRSCPSLKLSSLTRRTHLLSPSVLQDLREAGSDDSRGNGHDADCNKDLDDIDHDAKRRKVNERVVTGKKNHIVLQRVGDVAESPVHDLLGWVRSDRHLRAPERCCEGCPDQRERKARDEQPSLLKTEDVINQSDARNVLIHLYQAENTEKTKDVVILVHSRGDARNVKWKDGEGIDETVKGEYLR